MTNPTPGQPTPVRDGTAMTNHDYAHVGELSMYYETHGSGPPMVLLHGSLGTIESCFADLLPRLAITHRVIAVELQGHGRTADIDRPLSYEAMADDVAALTRQLGITRADFVGYSMGGGVAIQLAARHPDLVRRVVYAGGANYHPSGFHPEILAMFASARPGDLNETRWHHAYSSVAPHPERWATLVAKVNHFDRTFAGWDPTHLRALRARTLLIIGDADIVHPRHVVEMFELLGGARAGDLHGVPDAQLAILPGTTHVSVLDRINWLDDMITEFLR